MVARRRGDLRSLRVCTFRRRSEDRRSRAATHNEDPAWSQVESVPVGTSNSDAALPTGIDWIARLVDPMTFTVIPFEGPV